MPDRMSGAAKVAILPWGNVIEDFLEGLGVSLAEFCSEMTGGWLFGYVQALQRADVDAAVFCVSGEVERPTTYMHRPTGAPIVVLPAPRSYRWLRKRVADPYAREVKHEVGRRAGLARRLQAAAFRDLGFYSATPLRVLARELRRRGCRAILCQEYEYARFDVCVALGRALRVPVFATFQGGNWRIGTLERLVRPLAIRGCAGFIVPTATEAERLRRRYRVAEHRIARIFNPLDLSLWTPVQRDEARAALGIEPSARVAVWHGRVDIRRKGLDVLLDAWRRVVAERAGADLQLVLVGTGSDAPRLRALLEAQPLPGLRWVDEYLLDRRLMKRYLSAADVYAFPSRHEGFPVAPLEAMACGLPIVAAAAPGVPDIFAAGEAHGGVVVPTGEAERFARSLGALLDEPRRTRMLGERARRRVEEAFSTVAVGRQLRAFLDSAGDGRGVRPPGQALRSSSEAPAP